MKQEILSIRNETFERMIRLNDSTISVLMKYMDFRMSQDVPLEEEALFLSLQKRRMSVRSIQSMVKEYSGDRQITPRDLKVSCANIIYARTHDINEVMERLGYQSVWWTNNLIVS